MSRLTYNPVYGIIAILERQKETRAEDGWASLLEGYPHMTRLRDFTNSVAGWPARVHDLAGAQNWNLDRVLTIDGIRKPKAHLAVDLTEKGNLILEWYPGWPPADEYDMSETDFKQWSRFLTPKPPMNRLITVRNMAVLIDRTKKPLTRSGQLFLSLLSRHFEYVIGEIGLLVDIQVESSLYLTYEGGEKWIMKDGVKKRAEIRQADVLTTEETTKRENERWLRKTFDTLNTSPGTFLSVFNEAGYSFYRAAQLFRKRDMGIGPDQTRKIATRLYKDFNPLYSEHCTQPPPGVQPPGSNIIKLQTE